MLHNNTAQAGAAVIEMCAGILRERGPTGYAYPYPGVVCIEEEDCIHSEGRCVVGLPFSGQAPKAMHADACMKPPKERFKVYIIQKIFLELLK